MAIFTTRPNSDNSPINLLCSSGSMHYTLVNEVVADDASYII